MPPEQRVKPASSNDVAELAGVSRSTVSNILNGKGARFPPATRERVLDAAKTLAYRPSPAGRSLATGRSDTVVVLLPNSTFGSNLQDAVDAAVARIMPMGGNVVVRFSGDTPEVTFEAISALRPLAVLAFNPLSTEARVRLEEMGTIVVPGRVQPTWPKQMPDAGMGRIQAELVLKRGPRPLWFAALADRRQDVYGPGRVSTLEDYCAENGLAALQLVSVPLHAEGAEAALRQIMSDGEPVGVACYNDDVAIALLSAARALGVKVPDELSIAGVDHTPLGQLWDPRLTTIDPDLEGLISDYADELQARLSGEEPWHNAPRHSFTVVEGATT